MNFATAFYLSSQTPAQFTGPSLIFLLISSGIITQALEARNREKWISALDYHKAIITIAVAILLAIAQNLYLPYTLNPLTALHLSIYVSIYIASNSQKYMPTQQWAIKLTTILNFLLLLGFWIPLIREVAFIEKTGGLRFQSYFSEPSVAAFIFVYNISQTLENGTSSISRKIIITLNLICLVFTYSGSGFLLAGLIFAVRNIRNISVLTTVKAIAAVSAVTLLGGTVLADQLNQLVLSRVQAIMENQADNSTFLRFVAPWLFVDDLIRNGHFAWTGTGIGGLVPYIEQNQTRLWYLVDFEGQTVYNINNGYAAVIAMLGIPAGGLLIAALFRHLKKSKASAATKLLVASYPFFSGYVIHPFLWLLIANAGQSKTLNRKQ